MHVILVSHLDLPIISDDDSVGFIQAKRTKKAGIVGKYGGFQHFLLSSSSFFFLIIDVLH